MLLNDSWPACSKFVAYCIPDLQLDVFVVYGDHFSAEFHTDGHFMLLSESLVDELQQEARLADTYVATVRTGITDDDEFEHVSVGHDGR